MRHPLERAISSYYSKAACGVGDGHEKAAQIAALMHAAPQAAARTQLLHYNDRQPRRRVKHNGVEVSTPCLDFRDWAAMLQEAHRVNESRISRDSISHPSLDPHFMPQTATCGLGAVWYHRLIPLELPDAALRKLAEALRVPYEPLPHRHRTRPAAKQVTNISLAAQHLLATVYVDDLQLLRYDEGINNPSKAV